jgi:hypothetical protein
MLLEQERGKVINSATRETLPPHTGSAYNYVNYGQFIAQAATDGVDAAQAQTLSDAKTPFSPSEVVVNAVVSDRTITRVSDPKLLAEVGEMAMNAIELKEDQDGCAKFSSFTPTVAGTTVALTLGHLLAGEAILRVGNSVSNPEPAPQPWFATLHPNTMASAAVKTIPLSSGIIGSSASVLTSIDNAVGKLGAAVATGVTNDIGMRVLMGKGLVRQLDLGELMVMADANCAISGADAKSGIYSKRGLVFVSEVTPYMRQERDESLRGVEITAVTSYAWGVYRPAAYGAYVLADATQPTS